VVDDRLDLQRLQGRKNRVVEARSISHSAQQANVIYVCCWLLGKLCKLRVMSLSNILSDGYTRTGMFQVAVMKLAHIILSFDGSD
jgi:hypothetical protein